MNKYKTGDLLVPVDWTGHPVVGYTYLVLEVPTAYKEEYKTLTSYAKEEENVVELWSIEAIEHASYFRKLTENV